jgi:hypothetical protein
VNFEICASCYEKLLSACKYRFFFVFCHVILCSKMILLEGLCSCICHVPGRGFYLALLMKDDSGLVVGLAYISMDPP